MDLYTRADTGDEVMITTQDVRDILVRGALLGLLSLGVFVACANCGTNPPIPTQATCDAACARGAQLGCEWARPTHLGATCGAVCLNAADKVPWNVACLSVAASCVAADACP
jgi:hypothetical protein